MTNNTILAKTVVRTKAAFDAAKLYSNKKREHSAYIYLNSRVKKQALRYTVKELVVEGIKTGLVTIDNDVFRVEPIFDNGGNYICEEILYLGTRDAGGKISNEPLSEGTGLI